MESIDQTGLFEYHRGMLQDAERVDRYRDAIHAVVNEGDTVVDIGTGTGLLAFYACQAGARHVYAIEARPIIRLARELARANGFADRITFINESSARAALPERADVLVTETLWNFGMGEGMLGFLDDARRRMLKPDATIVPSRVDLYIAPLEAAELHATVANTPEDRNGIDFSVMRAYAVNQLQIPRVQPSQLLAEPAQLVSVGLYDQPDADFGASVVLEANREGRLHALVGWFESELAPGIRLGNAPPAKGSWAHAVFPLESAPSVQAGASITARVNSVGNGRDWRWATEVDGERFDQTTVFGFPRDSERHGLRAATARPVLAPHGEALRLVLSRLDGQSSIEEIAKELEVRTDVFMQPEAAAHFVRDAAEQYGA